MTTSKFKAYGTFALIMTGLLFLATIFFIYVLISVVFFGGNIVPRGTLPSYGAIIFVALLLLILASIIKSWTTYAYDIEINTDDRTIFFKNIFSRRTTLYNFSDFDGYFDTFVIAPKVDNYKVVYLIKDNRVEKIMTGFYYSNIDNLQDAISSLKYFGFQKNFCKISRKTLFNKAIFDEGEA